MAIYRKGNEFSDIPFSAEQLQRDIGRLQAREPGIKPLADAATPRPIREQTAVAQDTPDLTSGGIASPLTETAVADRTYHAGLYITTTDGLFSWPAVATMTFSDASGREVEIVFAAPA